MSVESPHWFCSASRAQDELNKEGWMGARMAKSIFEKHLCPSEWPQKAGSAWILISIRGGFICLIPSVCVLSHSSLNPLCVPPPAPSYPKNSCSLVISSDHFSHFPFPGGFISTRLSPFSLLFHPVILSSLFLFLSLLILSPGFPGSKWLTSTVFI